MEKNFKFIFLYPAKLLFKIFNCSHDGVTGTRSTLPFQTTKSLNKINETMVHQTLDNRQHRTVNAERR